MSPKAAAVSDPLSATQTIFRVLEPLAADVQQRVLASALSLLGIAAPTNASSSNSTPSSPIVKAGERQMSLGELYKQSEPATNAQKLAVFAYYKEKFEGKSTFSPTELRPYF